MEFILILVAIFFVAGMCEGPNERATKTRKLDPGGRDDFGGGLK